ncbi:MAG TPA: Rrf2 family transcriptional regulator [Pseudonocardia sp.]|jgi:Rrf2 family protein|uniref:Rrf2 family transcriptional regulator n=1 Tax=Pseudonocardia sp. TaxID=60912 RepID=UPI002B4B4973|nr:Rrf2 family transcriptional regulator [Pseudonocardia sp.]HLU55687.1 Rrf2 family transcriptional regulator [Pseudonocardia sp.]
MAANSRLTVAAHALAWMALVRRSSDEFVTSERIAASVNTNPVVIRRAIGRLRAAGIVEVQRGAGAGCRLARPPESITLREVYEAVEHEPLFGLHARPPNQGCPVGRGIQPALAKVYGGVEDALRAELERTTVADLLIDVLASAWRTAVEPASDAPPGTPA